LQVSRCWNCGTDKAKAVLVSAHVLQALLGYVLMLAAMSYSVELLFSALVGLGVGYGLCYDMDYDGAENSHDDEDDDEEEEGYDEEEEYGDDEREMDAREEHGVTAASGMGAGTCCDFAAATAAAGATSSATGRRGGGPPPPRRAFRFPGLRSPVPTLAGVMDGTRRREGGEDGDGDAHQPLLLPAAQDAEEGEGRASTNTADYLRLQEDDKMTPLL